jgi:hypothetical protein
MDDMLVFGRDRVLLKAELERIRQYLHGRLDLRLKADTQLNRCRRGFAFLGYRVFPGRIMLSQRSKRRFLHKFKHYERMWHDGQWSTDELARHMEPLIEFTRAAGATGLRRSAIQRFGVSS